MNEFSAIIIGSLGLATLIGYGLLLRQHRAQSRQIAELSAKLDVFVQTSIDVARCVDQVVTSGVKEQSVSTVASRRWLITEARERIAQGQKISDIAVPLGLSKDEVHLLRIAKH
jgi:hypothetical protein